MFNTELKSVFQKEAVFEQFLKMSNLWFFALMRKRKFTKEFQMKISYVVSAGIRGLIKDA